jgi:hypothetical protein
MQLGPVAAWTGHALAREICMAAGLECEAGRCEYIKGQESFGMPRKHPELFSLSVPPHKM